MSERAEFVTKAAAGETSISGLSRAYGVSRKTAYKWLARFGAEGEPGLKDRSRKPARSPRLTPGEMEAQICALRAQHPAWGGRKLHHCLLADGVADVPAPSTITGILARNDLLRPDRRLQRDWQRFEEDAPNALWQMDFKGHFPTDEGRCHPLTICDDHSRFNICLAACRDERAGTVKTEFVRVFERYGLPQRMLMDNGSPWGSTSVLSHTRLTAWLIRLEIAVSHGRPYHPQTQGKEERFHGTLRLEVLDQKPSWTGFVEVQTALDAWQQVYNFRRPHEALAYKTPSSRYEPSPRQFPSRLPEISYEPGDLVRKVQNKGEIYFRGQPYLVGHAFMGEPVALRAIGDDVWSIYYCHQYLRTLDLACPSPEEV